MMRMLWAVVIIVNELVMTIHGANMASGAKMALTRVQTSRHTDGMRCKTGRVSVPIAL